MALAQQVPGLWAFLLQQLAATACSGGMRYAGASRHREPPVVFRGAVIGVLPVAAEPQKEPRCGGAAVHIAQDVSLWAEGCGEIRRLSNRLDEQEIQDGLSEHGAW